MKSLLTFVATSLLFSAEALAASYFVKPVTGPMAADDRSAVEELIVTAVRGTSGQSVAKSESTAELVLEPRLTKLGAAYILTISKVRGGEVVFQEQGRAASIEEMDLVARRVVRAVITEKNFDGDARVSDVTQSEASAGVRRRDVVSQWVIGFGPGVTSKMNTSKTPAAWTIGYNWGISPVSTIRLNFDFGSPKDSSAGWSNFNIGYDHFFSEAETSPFVTGDFGYGSATAHEPDAVFFSDDRASGFTLSVGGGLRFFRTSRVNLGLTAKYTHYLDDNSLGNPSVTTLLLGVYF